MNQHEADLIVERAAGVSQAVWADEHRDFWAAELLRYEDAQIAELVLVRLASRPARDGRAIRPSLHEFESLYRQERQPRMAVRPRGEGCDGTRFIDNGDGRSVRPCPTCNPTLAARVAEGIHHEQFSLLDAEVAEIPGRACPPRPSEGPLVSPSAAIMRMLLSGDREAAQRLCGLATDGIVRQRVNAACAAKGIEPPDWSGKAAPFLKPAFTPAETASMRPAPVTSWPDDDDF